jgi:DNA-binding NtrC family response regulator
MSQENLKPVILIFEDEEGVRESFKLILEDIYTLKFAHNALEAMDMLRTLSPKAMLLDIKMPKMSGLSALKDIKKMKPSMPVIIVTGYQSTEMAQEAIRLGASDYIPKPFESKQILKAIATVIP